MAELQISRNETPGIQKEIDSGAMDLIFSAIQEDIYSFPIRSFVREAISNGLDAIEEREIYFKIRSGEPVEKFYRQEQDGKLLKDSDFTPEYYDLSSLSKELKVFVRYTIPSEGRRHLISIKDYGVGLGGSRLRGFFSLGFSTKRNLKAVFGKFGSGAKAGLATGAEYFIMHTVYNGYKSSFMIFKTDYEAITPKSETTVEDPWDVKLINGSTTTKMVYWEPTSEKNSVEIELEVKAHNESSFKNAVIDQFQHFNGKVRFDFMMFKDGVWHKDTLDAKPLYESENILIPLRSSYHSPIILIDGISYGPINWQELELENRRGAIALKTSATEIDITQSRESVKYTERTKKVILKAIENAEEEATEYMSSKIPDNTSSDLFALLSNSKEVNKEQDSTIRSFAKFLDLTNLKLKYTFKKEWFAGKKIDTSVNQKLFDALFYNYKMTTVSVFLRNNKAVIKSTKVESFDDLTNVKFVFAEDSALGPKAANHILGELNVHSFVYVRANSMARLTTTLDKKDYEPYYFKKYARELFLRSCDIYLDKYEYENENFEGDLEGSEAKLDVISLAKLRKLNSEILYRYIGNYNDNYKSMVLKISSLKAHFTQFENVIIATQEYRKWGDFIVDAYSAMDKNVYVIYVARDVIRDFLPYGTFITEHLRNYNPITNELTISPIFRFHNTALKALDLKDKYGDTYNSNLVERITPSIEEHLNIYFPAKIHYSINSDVDFFIDKINNNSFECNNLTDTYDEEFIFELESTLKRLETIKDLVPNLVGNYNPGGIKLINTLINTLNENT